jgi:hypothetical protein
MSTSSNVLNIPGRSMDHRPAWLLMVAAAAGAAITISVSALVGRAPAPAPAAVRAAASANAAGSDGSSTISSLRPFSDSTFQVSVDSGVPAIDQAGVVLNYPGGTVQVSAGGSVSAGEAVQAPYAPGTIYAYPGGTVQIGMIGAGGSNENAPAVSNCHQCR